MPPPVLAEDAGFLQFSPSVGGKEGSDPARAIHTRGHQDGDEWVINGSKLYISGADRADFALVFARTSDDPGRTE